MADKYQTKAWREYEHALTAVIKARQKFHATLEQVEHCSRQSSYRDASGKPTKTFQRWIDAHEKNRKALEKASSAYNRVCSKYGVDPNTEPYKVKSYFEVR